MKNAARHNDCDRESLARFQSSLLDLLDLGLPPDMVIARLKEDPALESFHEYIDGFEPRMVEVAQELVKKWGRRR